MVNVLACCAVVGVNARHLIDGRRWIDAYGIVMDIRIQIRSIILSLPRPRNYRTPCVYSCAAVTTLSFFTPSSRYRFTVILDTERDVR